MERLVDSDTCPNCGGYRTLWWTREGPDVEPVLVKRRCQSGCTEEQMDAAEAALGM